MATDRKGPAKMVQSHTQDERKDRVVQKVWETESIGKRRMGRPSKQFNTVIVEIFRENKIT